MTSENSTLGKYHLCPNLAIKTVYFAGMFLQAFTLALAVTMLSLGGWVNVNIADPVTTADNRYEYSRAEGILQDCYLNDQPTGGFHDQSNKCYMKDFGQYAKPFYDDYQKSISIAGISLVACGLISSAIDLVTGLHLAFIWFKAPYDSFYIRTYRLFIGFVASVSSYFFLTAMVIYHISLRLSIQKIPYDKLTTVTVTPGSGYYVAWACVGASILAAWVIISSTCCWAMDYVNCKSLAAAFYPTCSQRASTLSMANGVQSSVYSLNNDGVWSIQDAPTLPRYYTSTYGDGSELRNRPGLPKPDDIPSTSEKPTGDVKK